jgi:murein L,D-transpeptidase YcbB/YkuD
VTGAAFLVVAALLGVHRVAAAQALHERLRARLGAEPQDALRPLLARVYEQRASAASSSSLAVASTFASTILPRDRSSSIASAPSVTAASGSVEQVVPLPLPIPTHLTYWTVWVDDDGTIEFRDDIYGWDERLAAALRARGSSPAH